MDAALVFEREVVPDLLEVGLDLSWLTLLVALGALFEQRVDPGLAAFDRTQGHIGFRAAQRFSKPLVKGGVSLGFGGSEFGVEVRAVLLLGVSRGALGEGEQMGEDERLDHTGLDRGWRRAAPASLIRLTAVFEEILAVPRLAHLRLHRVAASTAAEDARKQAGSLA